MHAVDRALGDLLSCFRRGIVANDLDLGEFAGGFDGGHVPVFWLTPSRPHAETSRPVVLRAAGRIEHVIDLEHLLPSHFRLIMGGLRAIRAVFRTATGFDAQQRAKLYFLRRLGREVGRASAVEQLEEWTVVNGVNLIETPVVSDGRIVLHES